MLPENRRDADRVSIFTTVEMVLPNGDIVPATTLDIGSTGVAIWATGTRPTGPVRLRLPLEDGAPPVEVDGRVVREFRSDGGAVWGVEFQGVGPQAMARIMAFTRARATG